MIFRKLEAKSLHKIGSVKSISEFSDASTTSKIISCKKFDDNESDITTAYNIDSISPIQRPNSISSVILVKSKTQKSTYTHFDSSPSQSPSQDKKDDLSMWLKVSKNTLMIKICPASILSSESIDGADKKIEDITFEQLQRVSALDISFAPNMLISDDHLIMQEIKQIVDYFVGIYKVSLDLSYCKFESENVTSSISRMMKGMGFLTEIELNFTGCGIEDKFLNSLITEFKHLNLHNLRKLSLILNQNKIDEICMLFLSNLFEDMINLNNLSLGLQNCSISNKMLSLISYHISQNKKLKSFTMDLQNNLFNDDGIQLMCENLYTPKNFKLEEICLNLEHYEFQSEDLKEFTYCLNKIYNLKELHLNLSSNKLNDNFSTMLGSSFKSLRELKVLKIDLSSNEFSNNGAQFLQQLFKSDSLEVFDINLSNNNIGKGVGYSIATQLFFSANLRIIKLDLSNTGMDDKSINFLLNQLKNNYSLEELYINFNGNKYEISSSTILCENLSTNPLLRKIEIIPRKQENTIKEKILSVIEEKAISRYQNTLQCIAFKSQLSKYLNGDSYEIFYDIYDD